MGKSMVDSWRQWVITVDGNAVMCVLAATGHEAYDVAERVWDAQHGKRDFDKRAVGVVMVQHG